MAKSKMQQVAVSERALLGRLNRHMAADEETIKRCRADRREHGDLGDYYSISLRFNSIVAKHIDLEALARETGVLKPYEKLEDLT